MKKEDIKKAFEYMNKVAIIYKKLPKAEFKAFEQEYERAKSKQEVYDIVDAKYTEALKM